LDSSVAYYINKSSLLSKIFATLGAASFVILLFHYIFQVKAFHLASALMGGRNVIAELSAFAVGITAPTIIWYFLKKNDHISIVFMPIKYNKTFNRSD
jgi:fucose 4-O-acetylase-like acetyltransferase